MRGQNGEGKRTEQSILAPLCNPSSTWEVKGQPLLHQAFKFHIIHIRLGYMKTYPKKKK